MKKCASCNQKKPLDEFHKRTKAKDGLQAICKVCNKEQRKEYYKTAHGRDKNIMTGKRWSSAMRKKVFEYLLEHPCVDCGEADPVVLEFDHRVREDKSNNIARLTASHGWDRISQEIAKCDVRCANCHKRRTAIQFAWAKSVWYDSARLETRGH